MSSTGRLVLPRQALVATGATFFLMGALASSYGPLLEHFRERFGVTLSQAGLALSVQFAGGLLGVVISMFVLDRVTGRQFAIAGLAFLALGCAAAALAPAWPAFIAAVFVIGAAFGALDLGLNQLVAHSDIGHRARLLNSLHGAFGLGAVAGPILVAAGAGERLPVFYAACAALALLVTPAAAGIAGRLPVVDRISGEGLDRLVVIFALGYVAYVAVENGVGGWMTSHLESVGNSTGNAALFTSGFWLALAVGRLVVTALPSVVREGTVVMVSSTLSCVALIAAATIPGIAPAAYAVAGLAFGPIFPTGIIWLAKLRPGDSRATAWLFPASMVGGVLGPGLVGLVIAQRGVGVTPAVLTAVAVAMLLVFAAASRWHPLVRRA